MDNPEGCVRKLTVLLVNDGLVYESDTSHSIQGVHYII